MPQDKIKSLILKNKASVIVSQPVRILGFEEQEGQASQCSSEKQWRASRWRNG